ncbi:hypothetical protein LTR10_014572 [Elasticomyces elasticus]|uniref:Metallo-beta-lactamase domain-containing protein n=1 Tax=Exophiala sideris TaxID=1016849 RepID=A0ABR0JSF9_9EURO|nr:hypothetical protein LTR10_014572 [Elasticomyces elasticus]KAK5040550.1 hypothetical protein LTS07_001048 [Exophiala sideris]KAK5043025.1 hypothetical protein LTR13_000796 [Exophiala sideris]KAK5068928.1 hypothetical protein LTR69_001049 [Exophiala sideris]KAK5186525.1 hypothetical protein LTR44_001581 [Eurotiomycetes sp. CCFEE 6388]
MRSEDCVRLSMPASCPFTISRINLTSESGHDTWLIREHDQYGEYPHIYAKSLPRCQHGGSIDSKEMASVIADKVIVLSDAGCGTEVPNTTTIDHSTLADNNQIPSKARTGPEPEVWNLRTFLEYTINPDGRIPYLVVSTHCHYDHILGLAKLPHTTTGDALAPGNQENLVGSRPATTVLASSHDKSFVTPYSNLQRHSLCKSVGLKAHAYSITWAEDLSRVTWRSPSPPTEPSIPTSITVLHTPGHTPDSLSWYDADLALLCVGDTFYVKETDVTRASPWGPEPPMPTIFPSEGNMADLWQTLKKLLDFVQARNQELLSQHDLSRTKVARCHSHRCAGQDQCGFYHEQTLEPLFREEMVNSWMEDDWLFVDLQLESPRVYLAAAHTTVSLDAEAAIKSFGEFMARVLRDQIPKVRVDDGGHGEERWLWDYALQDDGHARSHEGGKDDDEDTAESNPDDDLRYLYQFSVVAPLKIIEEGRKKIALDDYLI